MSSSPVTAQLILIQGDSESFQQVIELDNRNRSIGRAQNCDIIWGSLQISRKHATLEYMCPKWYIRDTSTNGLSVNGVKLIKGEMFPLKDLDIIGFIPTGVVRYRFKYIVPSPPRGLPAPRPTTAGPISPQPSTSNSALAASTSSIPRSSVITSTATARQLPVVATVESSHSESEDSNHSESLLSLDPPDDYFSFSGDEHVQSPAGDSDNASSGPPVSKRKHIVDSSSDSDGSSVDRKKKRMQIISSSDDDDSDKSDSHDVSSGSNYKTLRLESKHFNEDAIDKCGDLELLKARLKECMTKLKSKECRLKSLECERDMEKEEFRKRERDVRSVNTAFKEETYKKILELMESEISCAVCNEVFIQATVIDCGHTFCHFCINEWARKKMECPICRKSFRNRSRHIEMENFITKMFESFSEEISARRKVSLKEREDQAKKALDDARAAATENQNQAGRGNGNNFHAFIQTTAERYVDFLAELHQINEILGPRGNGRGGNSAASAERRRSARIQDRVIDAVVADVAGGAGSRAQGAMHRPVPRAHRGRGRAAVNANNVHVQAPAPMPVPGRMTIRTAAERQVPAANRIPVVTLNDSEDGHGNGAGGMRLPGIQNQFMNYVRNIPLPQLNLNLMGDGRGAGHGGAPN